MSEEIEKRKQQLERIKVAALPLIKLLNEEYHPHVTAIVTSTSIEIMEGIASYPKIYDFIKDAPDTKCNECKWLGKYSDLHEKVNEDKICPQCGSHSALEDL